MKSFEHDYYLDIPVTHDTLKAIRLIGEFRGRQALYKNQTPEILESLRADILVQEYGRYFEMKTGVFRGGCLTGPSHSGTELHGFLSYLVKCAIGGMPYTIYGYKGKQVRDNIHSKDLINAFDCFINKPRYVSRSGDHIWYISDVRKFQAHYPEWHYEYNIDRILDEMVASCVASLKNARRK